MMNERKIYPALDIAKFAMAVLILTQHTSNEWAHSTGLVHAAFGLGNFAVPFFFACSGFLFFTKCNKLTGGGIQEYYKSWSWRIGRMYLVWSAIYFCFVLAGWLTDGVSAAEVVSYLHRSLVFTTYATIWFLPALWVGVSVCLWLRLHAGKRVAWTVVAALLVAGNGFASYGNVLAKLPALASVNEAYTAVFVTWRNGLFNGAPYVFLGALLADGCGAKLSRNVSAAACAAFSAAFLAEAFAISRYKTGGMTDMGFMMYPAIFFMLAAILRTDVAPRPLWLRLRNLSMLVFLGQRLFLTAIPSVLPGSVREAVEQWPEPCIFLLFAVLALGFSCLVERLSERYKPLKVLW